MFVKSIYFLFYSPYRQARFQLFNYWTSIKLQNENRTACCRKWQLFCVVKSEENKNRKLPAAFLVPAPHVWAPRSYAWSPPSPGAGRRLVGPDAGCCCGCGCPSAPPSFQWLGTWVSVGGLQMMGLFHSSCQTRTHYTEISWLTWNYNKLLSVFNYYITHYSTYVITFTIKTNGVWTESTEN